MGYPKNRKSRGPLSAEMKAKISVGVLRYARNHSERYDENNRQKISTGVHRAFVNGKMAENSGWYKVGHIASKRVIEKRTAKLRGPLHWNWQNKKKQILCETCQRSIYVYAPTRFCSKKCYWKWLKISGVMSGSNSPHWRGGPHPYPEGWRESLREAIRERDNYCCQLCHKTYEENNGRRLSVHHIDEVKKNLNPKNLVALCTSCHQALHNSNFKMNRCPRKGKVIYDLHTTN